MTLQKLLPPTVSSVYQGHPSRGEGQGVGEVTLFITFVLINVYDAGSVKTIKFCRGSNAVGPDILCVQGIPDF